MKSKPWLLIQVVLAGLTAGYITCKVILTYKIKPSSTQAHLNRQNTILQSIRYVMTPCSFFHGTWHISSEMQWKSVHKVIIKKQHKHTDTHKQTHILH